MPDPLAQFRPLLSKGGNRVSTSPPPNHGNVTGGGYGGGGSNTGGGFDWRGGMDPWQTSVENRLVALENRLSGVEANVASVDGKLGILTERVSHMPTKGWAVTSLLLALAVIAGLIGYAGTVQKLVGQKPATSVISASEVPQSDGERPPA